MDCSCSLPAVRKISHSQRNFNRPFYTCNNKTYDRISRSYTGGCNLFAWIEEPPEEEPIAVEPVPVIENAYTTEHISSLENINELLYIEEIVMIKLNKTLPIQPKHIIDKLFRGWVDKDCSVCLDKMTKKTFQVTSCGHAFCSTCISSLKEKNHRCPICRCK